MEPTLLKKASLADIAFADKLLQRGASEDDVHAALVKRGVDDRTAAAIVASLTEQDLHENAAAMRDNGLSREETEQYLVESGMSESVASNVVHEIDEAKQKPVKRDLRFLGFLAINIGFVLYYLHATGRLTAFPYAEYLLIAMGMLFFALSEI